MIKTWTRYDIEPGFNVQFKLISSDVMEITLFEHSTPIYSWEVEEFKDSLYYQTDALPDEQDQTIMKMVKWVEDFINDKGIDEMVGVVMNNPDLFTTHEGIRTQYVYNFNSNFHSILTHTTFGDEHHLNVMYYKGDTKLGWSEYLTDGSEGKFDWSNFMLSIELATMERSIRNAVRPFGVPKFISCIDNGLNLVELGSANLNRRIVNNAIMTFTKVEQK